MVISPKFSFLSCFFMAGKELIIMHSLSVESLCSNQIALHHWFVIQTVLQVQIPVMAKRAYRYNYLEGEINILCIPV